MRMARIVWIYFMTKFVEFFDTFFFIARKKFAHVSALQVIHHGIMPVFSYCLTRWLPGKLFHLYLSVSNYRKAYLLIASYFLSSGGQESFGGMLNSVVHVIMYSYYFLAALGPHMQPYLWWKKYLTTFQMIQFTMVFVKSMVVITGFRSCGFPWQFSLITASMMMLFFGLFANFYVQAYTKKARKNRDE